MEWVAWLVIWLAGGIMFTTGLAIGLWLGAKLYDWLEKK